MTSILSGEEVKTMLSKYPKRAVVLAAGRGKRLRPFTDHTPKPLLPVNGRPTLDYILQALVTAGVTEACFIIGHLGEQIEAYVGDGSAWGMRVCFVRQMELHGTAHALQTAVSFLEEPAFVLAADYLLPPNYLRALKSAYLEAGASLAVALRQLPPGEASSRSSVAFDAGGRIVEIVEKPAPGTAPSDIGASLIYIVSPDISRYLRDMQPSSRGEYEIQAVINRMVRDGYKIAGLLQDAPKEWEKGSHGGKVWDAE